MFWCLPRSDPGAATKYRRPNGCGVSTKRGNPLPYGRFARLMLLWLYAEVLRTGRPQRRPRLLVLRLPVGASRARRTRPARAGRPALRLHAAFRGLGLAHHAGEHGRVGQRRGRSLARHPPAARRVGGPVCSGRRSDAPAPGAAVHAPPRCAAALGVRARRVPVGTPGTPSPRRPRRLGSRSTARSLKPPCGGRARTRSPPSRASSTR